MKTYHKLSQVSFLKKYSYKFLFVAFLGIHIPLLGIIMYALFATTISTTTFILITLGLTLGATALTLKVLDALLDPIIKGKNALNAFVQDKTEPDLPTNYTDEVGEMLRNIQFTIERLDEVDQEKQDIIELISHDLRTPVLQTLGIIDFLKEDGDDPQKRQEYITLLNEVATKQVKFLEDMLKILKAKHLEISSKNFEMLSASEIINAIIHTYKKPIEAKQLVIGINLPAQLSIRGHANGITQVFENLVNNAIKFSQKNGEIRISGEETKNEVKIIIKDYGIGFNDRTKSTLFKKFVPGHLGTSGEPTTGLGLYLTKKIVEKHGGTLEPYSAGKGTGAQFVVSIPK
ncbi:sensor histidine kinase [Bizionia sp.]|uniref:sensor histidine kinase n=1 Tax=Bizionia sp. TaxID=1954480 RepID=UPI003A9039E4